MEMDGIGHNGCFAKATYSFLVSFSQSDILFLDLVFTFDSAFAEGIEGRCQVPCRAKEATGLLTLRKLRTNLIR